MDMGRIPGGETLHRLSRTPSCTVRTWEVKTSANDADAISAAFAQTSWPLATGGAGLSINSLSEDQLAAAAREQDEYYRVFYTPPPSKEGVKPHTQGGAQ